MFARGTLARMTDGKPLCEIEIADPCPVAWDEMSGTDAQRHCAQCSKTVHDLSAMAPAAAAALLAGAAPGGTCVRVRCDRDGFVIHHAALTPKCAHRRLRPLTPVLAAIAACSVPTESESSLVVEGPAITASAAVHESSLVRMLPAQAEATGIAHAAASGPESRAPKPAPLLAPALARPPASAAPAQRALRPKRRANPGKRRDNAHEEWLAEHPRAGAKDEEFEVMGFSI